MRNRNKLAIMAIATVGLLGLAGCSGGSSDTASGGEKKDVTIAVFNGWDEGIATSWLWKTILEDKGYTVTLENADVAPVFEGLKSGDYDFTTDVWLPNTHKEYLENYGEDIVELGAWNKESKLTVAVNEDAPIDSLSDLAKNADKFGNTIVGIEPGAGLTSVMENDVIPGYKLDDMKFVTSTTAAMLTELKSATKNGENIVVTLWEPHWAYGAFPLKNLEDPDGLLGGTETLYTYSSKEFPKASPKVAGWLKNFTMDLDTLYTLEQAMFVDYDGDDYGPIVEKWIKDNKKYVDSLTS